MIISAYLIEFSSFPPLVWIIVALTAIGVVSQAIICQFYARQMRWLDHTKELTEDNGKRDFQTLLGQVEEDTPVRMVLELLDKGVNRDESSAVLAQLEMYEDRRLSNAVSNTLVSSLLVLGLAGTLFGFMRIIGTAPPFLNSQGLVDSSSIENFVKTLLPGFSHAFLSSIAGIAGTTLLFSLRSLMVMPRRMRLFSRLQHLVQSFASAPSAGMPSVSPAWSGAIETAVTQLAATARSVETLAKGITKSNQQSSDTAASLVKCLTEFAAITDQTRALSQSLVETSSVLAKFCEADSPLDAIVTHLNNTVATLQKTVERVAENRAADHASLAVSEAHLGESVDNLRHTVEKEAEGRAAKHSTHVAALDRLEGIATATMEASRMVGTSAKNASAHADSLGANVGKLQSSMDLLQKDLSKLGNFEQRLADVQSLVGHVNDFVTTSEKSQQSSATHWAQAVQMLNQSAQRQEAACNGLAENVGTLQSGIRQECDRLASELSGTVHELAYTITAFKNEVASMKETFAIFRMQLDRTPPGNGLVYRWRKRWARFMSKPDKR